MKRILIILSVFIIFGSLNVFAQNSENTDVIRLIEESYRTDIPLWLLMERGKQAFSIGEFGLASRVFREVLNREGSNPDAEVWLARIFEQEGELTLAEKQYQKALEYKNDLYIADDQIEVLYSLAEIYRKTDQYGKYEKTLLDIIDYDQTSNILNLQYSMLDAFKNYSLDKMFELYRYSESRYNRARTELGIFYYQTGRYTESQINLVIPLISSASDGFDYIYNRTADYEYRSFDIHIAEINSYGELKIFLENEDYYRTVYYLGAAMFADGYIEQATALWQIAVNYDDPDSIWSVKSSRQLRSPFIEPIISPRT